MNTVSVIIPTWNSATTLRATISSCLNQTVPPLEVLVCDDGSTDESKAIVESFNSPTVRWITGEHTGSPGAPRNRGIREAAGFWLAFCDSDDEWVPEKLAVELEVASRTGSRALCTNIKGVNEPNNLLKKITIYSLIMSNTIVCSSVLVQRSLMIELGGFSEDIEHASYEDYLCWLRILLVTNFTLINKPLVFYRDHPETSIRAIRIPDIVMKKKAFSSFLLVPKKLRISLLKKISIRIACLYYFIRHHHTARHS